MLLTAIIAAILFTVGAAITWIADLLKGSTPTGVPPTRQLLMVMIGCAGVAWVSVVISVARDRVIHRIDEIGERWADTATSMANEAYQEGYFRGLRDSDERSGHDGHGKRGPDDGHVVPLRR